LPVYVFDAENLQRSCLGGAQKCNARRARFILESVACLRRRLEARGSGLLVAIGKPTDVVPRLSTGCGEVVMAPGVCSEETIQEAAVAKRLQSSCTLRKVWGGSLYHPDECGCKADDVPLLFTSFKNKAEGRGRIREPVAAPAKFPPLPDLPEDSQKSLKFLPSLEQLGYSAEDAKAALEDDPRGVLAFEGGEDAALQRMKSWMFDGDNLKDYFDIRNGMLGEGYSSKLSPWLAQGCISPRRIWMEAQRYEKERVKNKSTYWLIFELTWRDFYNFLALSQGDKIFLQGGLIDDKTPWKGGRDALQKWKDGRTGDQLVDANMRELKATGFMSNRGRQNVASYLIFDAQVDWRHGAAHFEEYLLDHDPMSNWGNWVAAAGLTGQRVNKFNTKKQLNDYDPKREYVNHWLKGPSAERPARQSATATSSSADPLEMTLDEIAASSRGGKGNDKGGGGKSGKAKGKGGKSKGGYMDDETNSAPKKQGRWGRKDAGRRDMDNAA